MLQQMIAGHVPMAKPILEDDLRDIFDKRIYVLQQYYTAILAQKWAFEPIPSISELKWRARLRRVFGLPNLKEHVMLDVARAIDGFHNGSTFYVFLKGAKHILGVFALWFTVFIFFDAFFLEGEELKALVDRVRTVISTLH